MFESERSLKFAAKRCQCLRWEVYELILVGIVSIAGTRNAGMMVPSNCQVCGYLCDQTHIINSQSSFGRQKMKKWNYNY
jgi:hypothetical protein